MKLKTFTTKEIRELMAAHEVYGQTEFNDREYISPTKRWFLNEFVEGLTSHLKGRGILDYEPKHADCDKFALWAWAYASEDNAATRPGAGITVGKFNYMPEMNIRNMRNEEHAVCFAALIPSQQLVFIDRIKTNGKTVICEIKLSASELRSCSSWYV